MRSGYSPPVVLATNRVRRFPMNPENYGEFNDGFNQQ
jgi:hypothetical protein